MRSLKRCSNAAGGRGKPRAPFLFLFLPAILFLSAVPVLAALFYGPYEPFRLLWINTALYSSRFKFLATALYSEEYIRSVLDKNKPAQDRKTDAGAVDISGGEGIYFDPVKGDYFRGFLIKIEDPRRVELVCSGDPRGMLLESMTAGHRALGGINASGYADEKQRGAPWGHTIVDGSLVSRSLRDGRHVMGGFTGDYKMVVGLFTDDEIAALQYRWAFEFGPLLIVNGEKTELTDFSGGLAPRSAIGQLKNGAVLLAVVDGRRPGSLGATFKDMQTILYANGAVNAIGLDGGSSATMVYRGKVVNTPSEGEAQRLLPNAIIFK